MNIRTVTVFVPGAPSPEAINFAGTFLASAAEAFRARGVAVQTRRVSFAHPVFAGRDAVTSDQLQTFCALDRACETNCVDFCSLGVVRDPDEIRLTARVLVRTSRLYAFAEVLPVNGRVRQSTVLATAEAIVHVGSESAAGLGNFRFAAGFSIQPGYPFFPASYQDGERPYFAVGTENSDLVVEAFEGAESLDEAEKNLEGLLSRALSPVEATARKLGEEGQIDFRGIDPSIAPILDERYSYERAFQALGIRIGESGTLAVCALITRVVRALNLSAVGFRGIMLPALEDFGLAGAVSAGRLDINKLLTYSSVCGVGLDMIPLPGATTSSDLVAVLSDVAALSRVLAKPLMARLLPIPGGKCGDFTTLISPYLCNARILSL